MQSPQNAPIGNFMLITASGFGNWWDAVEGNTWYENCFFCASVTSKSQDSFPSTIISTEGNWVALSNRGYGFKRFGKCSPLEVVGLVSCLRSWSWRYHWSYLLCRKRNRVGAWKRVPDSSNIIPESSIKKYVQIGIPFQFPRKNIEISCVSYLPEWLEGLRISLIGKKPYQVYREFSSEAGYSRNSSRLS